VSIFLENQKRLGYKFSFFLEQDGKTRHKNRAMFSHESSSSRWHFCSHFIALSRKNIVLKKRAFFTTLLEVMVPVALVALILSLKNLPALADQYFPTQQYTLDNGQQVLHVLPFGATPRVLMDSGFRIAVLPSSQTAPGAKAAAQKFITDMGTLHPPLSFSTVGGSGMNDINLRKVSIPGFSEISILFEDTASLQSYISADGYKKTTPGIWAAIVFNAAPSLDNPSTQWDVSIRMNASDATNTNGPPVNTFVSRYISGPILSYVYSKGVYNNRKTMPGFTTLQLEVDRWIISKNISTSSLNTDSVLFSVGEALGLLNGKNAQTFAAEMVLYAFTNTSKFSAITNDLKQWLKSSSFAPQQVDFVPFPTQGYTQNLFYTIVLPNLTLLFIIAYLVPVTRLVRGLVIEKELRLRELMGIMGLSPAAHFLSWLSLYFVIYFIIAACIAMIGTQIFPRSDPLLIFIIFWVFGISSTTFCVLVSVFFTRSRTATVLGGVCFFAAYFAYFGISTSSSVSRSTLLGGALLTPTALGLAMDVIGSLESNGVGLTRRTFDVSGGSSGIWSASQSFYMMILDTFLYAFLAWYADSVLPASWREFGVPKPLYFPFLPSFWLQDVFGFAPPKRSMSQSLLTKAKNLNSNHTVDESYLEVPDSNLQAKHSAGRCVELKSLRKEFATPDGTKVAVDDVDLTMYEGQIFVLLGHNGAGKTTTINMVTGMIQPTSGEAIIFGKDVSTDLSAIRADLGVCPQHDVLWPDLTVNEHLTLYCSLKNVPIEKRKEAAAEALRMVGLTEKVDALSGTLSGGQKRKLSVAIAFLGGSKIVFLDEPTSGMDPYSRRSTWQILQNAREGRVILLTTHFMDEADILGDRVCIMAHGQVRCCGSPMFLKERFGVGYVLTLVRDTLSRTSSRNSSSSSNDDEALKLVRRFVPEASVATNVGAELSLRLSLSSASTFPAMLGELERSFVQLGIVSYGISVTNIEDVFLKVSSGGIFGDTGNAIMALDNSETSQSPLMSLSDQQQSEAFVSKTVTIDNPLQSSFLVNDIVKDSELSAVDAARSKARAEKAPAAAFVQHFGALFRKRINYAKRDFRSVLCLLLIPIVQLCLGLGFIIVGQSVQPRDYVFTTSNFNTDQYNYIARQASTRPRFPNYVPSFSYKSSNGNRSFSPDTSALINSVAARSQYNLSTDKGNLFLSGDFVLDLDKRNSQGFINITSSIFPQRDYQRMSTFLLENKNSYAATKYGAILFTQNGTIVDSSVSGNFVDNPSSNAITYSVFHNTSAQHAGPLFMNLINSAILAVSNGTAAFISTHNFPLPLTALELKFALSRQSFSVIQVVLIATSFVPASFITFVVKEREVGAKHQQMVSGVSVLAYWLSNYVFDCLTYLLPWSLTISIIFAFSVNSLTQKELDVLWALMLNLLSFGPASCAFCYMISHIFGSHSTAQTVVIMLMILSFAGAIVVYVLVQVSSTCQMVPYLEPTFDLLPMFALSNSLQKLATMEILPSIAYACDTGNGGTKPLSAYPAFQTAFAPGVAGTGLAFLVVESFVYLTIAILFDFALRDARIRKRIDGDPQEPPSNLFVEPDDQDVADEANRVSSLLAPGSGPVKDDVVLLDNLRKVYRGGKAAVRGLSFGLPGGSVFGFLGINGAGKTSALKILSGDIFPSFGSAQLAGYDVVREQLQVRRLLGYCPQFDALLDLMSTREHLELYARIKGVPEKDLKKTVEKQLKSFDLVDYAGKLAGTLSGGNKRKLSVAIALIGDPPIVFLDEPSTGVDPVARRFMWGVISRVATEQRGCTIILTTHSMEEVEALCSSIGIMVGGRLRCLGTSQHLKSKFGQGFMSTLQLSPPSASVISQIVASVVSLNGGVNKEGSVLSGMPAVEAICSRLGKSARISEVNAMGSGWALFNAILATGSINVRDFAVWWAEEDVVEGVVEYMSIEFIGSKIIERQGLQLKMSIPPQKKGDSLALASMFERLEQARISKGVATYTLGQTTLEQVFNQFAATQEEETDSSRGIHHTDVKNVVQSVQSSLLSPATMNQIAPTTEVQNWRLSTKSKYSIK
jgi:ATP-binding cassette, subfamily A (ABC1), member 3